MAAIINRQTAPAKDAGSSGPTPKSRVASGTVLLTPFAGIALLLASLGIFAVIGYSVSQRTAEIGIRVACGASHGDIRSLIIRQGRSCRGSG